MNSILDRYINGKFEYKKGSLDFSCSKIELSVSKDVLVEGSFEIRCVGSKRAEGYVIVTDNRIKCLNRTFTGNEATIRYTFDSLGMEEGEVLRAEFQIISNMGEYYIPFIAVIDHTNMKSSMGNIKNLFHFANLAKTNWDEAVKLFYSKEFVSILTGVDKQYETVYRGLSKINGNEQNVDEFLINIHKKKRTEYIPMEELIRIDAPFGVSEGKATITRNGWGYTRLLIETDGDFITVEKEVLTDDDFLGNICSFNYRIDSAKLHAGNNYGAIIISNANFKTRIEFQVAGEQMKSLQLGNRRKMRTLMFDLLNLYLGFRLKKRSTASWLDESVKVVEQMIEIDEKNPATLLYKTQLLLTEERYNEAKWQLSMIEKEFEKITVSPEIKSYYLYLTSLSNREEGYVNKVAEMVEDIYRNNRGNWKIAWLMLYLIEDYSKSQVRRYEFLEQLFTENCTSPIIYVEAVLLIKANPMLLNKLSDFEIQVLNYAVKNDVLTKEMVRQILYLMTKVKDYSKRLYEILVKCYEVMPDEETLQHVVELLMKGNRTDEEAFSWYQMAVDKEMRITRLYEFYMMSLPLTYTKELPKMVMMYFAYHSELDYTRKALLYANILRYKEEFPDIAETYRETIDIFLVEQIRNGHVNRDLAYLYKNAMSAYAFKPEFAMELIPILFTNIITVEDENIKSVVVLYEQMKEENVYPVAADGTAFLPIYCSEYKIILQDAKGNRYYKDDGYTLEKLMIPGKYTKNFEETVEGPIGYDLYLCENAKTGITITESNYMPYTRLHKSDKMNEEYRAEIGLKLMQFCFDNDKIEEGEALLEQVQPDNLNYRMRAVYIQYFVSRGMLDKALLWLSTYGIDGVEATVLMRLCSRILARTEFEQDEVLLTIIYQTYRKGKYDANTIRYLTEYFEGMSKDMRDIWNSAHQFDIDTLKICEKMILQFLFTGAYVGQQEEIFEEYASKGGRLMVEMAYLTHSAYEYFVKDKIIDESIFVHLTRLFYRGEEFHKVCKLAYIKFYSECRDKITEEVLYLIRKFVSECLLENVYFPFFQKLSSCVPEVQKIMNKTIIEYRTDPDARVSIHYVLQKDSDAPGNYCEREMINMYEGVFVKAFTLFFGEKLQYYITEDFEGEEQLTQSDTIQKSELTQESDESKFYQINDMMIAKTLQEHETVDKLLEEYYHKAFVTKGMFTLL